MEEEIHSEAESDREMEEAEDLEEELVQLDPSEVNDLLFIVQNLGCNKTVGNVETYVKSEHCIDLMKELYKLLRNDNPESTLKKLELGEWNIVESDLLKLLVSYPDDKQVAFYCMVLLTTLTEKAEKEHANTQKYNEHLQKYKASIIASRDAIKVLVNHLADCLTKEATQRNEQHDQMLELIIYLIRNLLQIPDRKPTLFRSNQRLALFNCKEDMYTDLQRRFLHKLYDETVLEAIIFMSQDFSNPGLQKLNLCFLEIYYLIFKDINPADFYTTTDSTLTNLLQMERETRIAQSAKITTRHAKFNSTYVVTRKIDGSRALVSNPLKDSPNLYKQQHQNRPIHKENLKNLEMKDASSIDRELLKKLQSFAEDVLEHCFSPVIDSIFIDLYKESERLEPHDKQYYLLFQAFMFEFLRVKHYHEKEGPIDLDVSPIAESLKISNFEYMYRVFMMEVKKSSRKDFNTKDFHAAMKCCMQLLYIVKDMNISATENTRRNAQILLQNIFYHEMAKIARRAFDYWKAGLNEVKFLEEIIEFNAITMRLLEEYSKGRVLTVRTDKVVKSRKEGDESDDYMSGNEQYDSDIQYQERQLNFVIELSLLIDHDVISKYCYMLKRFRYNSLEMNEYIARFFLKILQDCQAEWIFYQLEYLAVFEEVVNDKYVKNNPKTKGVYEVIVQIVKAFVRTLQSNKLLAMEALFRVKDRSIKNAILSNYETELPSDSHMMPSEDNLDMQIYTDSPQKQSNIIWTKEEDSTLIENYYTFKDMDRYLEVLSNLFTNKSPKDVKKRLKLLRVSKGITKAKEMLEELHFTEDVYGIERTGPAAFKKLGKETVLNNLYKILSDAEAFYKEIGGDEMAIVPVTEEDFSMFTSKEWSCLLLGLGMRAPSEGEWCWRVVGNLDNFKAGIERLNLLDEETVEIDEDEEEEEYSTEMSKSWFN
jgi:timeless